MNVLKYMHLYMHNYLLPISYPSSLFLLDSKQIKKKLTGIINYYYRSKMYINYF